MIELVVFAIMIKIKNGIIERIGLPHVGTLTGGSTVSNYDKLPQETLIGDGWLPVEDDKPLFDTLTQYLVFDSYEILTDKVIARYKTIDVGLDPQTLEEKVALHDTKIVTMEEALDAIFGGV